MEKRRKALLAAIVLVVMFLMFFAGYKYKEATYYNMRPKRIPEKEMLESLESERARLEVRIKHLRDSLEQMRKIKRLRLEYLKLHREVGPERQED